MCRLLNWYKTTSQYFKLILAYTLREREREKKLWSNGLNINTNKSKIVNLWFARETDTLFISFTFHSWTLIHAALADFSMVSDYPLCEWIENAPKEIIKNKKGGFNLLFNGYEYVKEANFKTSTNWVCATRFKNSDKWEKCQARCVTRTDDSIKLSQRLHNHPPQFSKVIWIVAIATVLFFSQINWVWNVNSGREKIQLQ